jgi:hypothetical protein
MDQFGNKGLMIRRDRDVRLATGTAIRGAGE